MGPHINGDPVTGELGTMQCPLAPEGTCPADCTELNGRPIDPEDPCATTWVVVDCSAEGAGTIDMAACSVNLRTDQVVYLPHDIGLGTSWFLGWRACTSEEYALAVEGAFSCE